MQMEADLGSTDGKGTVRLCAHELSPTAWSAIFQESLARAGLPKCEPRLATIICLFDQTGDVTAGAIRSNMFGSIVRIRGDELVFGDKAHFLPVGSEVAIRDRLVQRVVNWTRSAAHELPPAFLRPDLPPALPPLKKTKYLDLETIESAGLASVIANGDGITFETLARAGIDGQDYIEDIGDDSESQTPLPVSKGKAPGAPKVPKLAAPKSASDSHVGPGPDGVPPSRKRASKPATLIKNLDSTREKLRIARADFVVAQKEYEAINDIDLPPSNLVEEREAAKARRAEAYKAKDKLSKLIRRTETRLEKLSADYETAWGRPYTGNSEVPTASVSANQTPRLSPATSSNPTPGASGITAPSKSKLPRTGPPKPKPKPNATPARKRTGLAPDITANPSPFRKKTKIGDEAEESEDDSPHPSDDEFLAGSGEGEDQEYDPNEPEEAEYEDEGDSRYAS